MGEWQCAATIGVGHYKPPLDCSKSLLKTRTVAGGLFMIGRIGLNNTD